MDMLDASFGDPLQPHEKAFDYAAAMLKQDPHRYCYDNTATEYSQKILANCGEFFSQYGIDAKSGKNFLGVSSGTTGALNVIAKDIKRRFYEQCGEQQKTVTPVIIMPVPSYGYFADALKMEGFEVATVERDRSRNWALDPEALRETVRKVNSTGNKQVVGFYDSNPNNPTGTIRDISQTREIAKVLKEEKGAVKFPVTFIDDIIYAGTEYDPHKKPGLFAALPECAKDSMTIFGGSKVGLAGLRTGGVISDSYNIVNLNAIAKLIQYYPNIHSLHAMAFTFGNSPEAKQAREEHFSSMNKEYAFNAKLLKALINGIDSANMNDAEREQAVQLVSAQKKISPDEARESLKHGIKGVKVVTTPEAGLHHLLDFSESKGIRLIDEGIIVNDQATIFALLHPYEVHLAAGSFCMFKQEDCMMRCTYAMPAPQIIEVVSRIDKALTHARERGREIIAPDGWAL